MKKYEIIYTKYNQLYYKIIKAKNIIQAEIKSKIKSQNIRNIYLYE